MDGLCLLISYSVCAAILVAAVGCTKCPKDCPRIKRNKIWRRWKIEIKTGDLSSSATNAHVWSAVRVGDQWSDDFLLDNPTWRRWKIEIKTGDLSSSATNAPVWSAVRVGDEWSDDFLLDNPNHNDYNQNALDVFRINTTAYNCERLSGFKIFIPEGTKADGWRVSWVRFTDEDDPTQIRYCLFNLWILNYDNPVPNFLFC